MFFLRKFFIIFLLIICSCEPNDTYKISYSCLGDIGGCTSTVGGEFETLEDCNLECVAKPNNLQTTITVFLYENCPIAQYMCGPLREASRYFCDTLNQNMIFRGFSPNSFSNEESILNFVDK